MIGSLNNTALAGIRNGFEQLQKNASQIASIASTSSGTVAAPSLLASVVDLKANVQQVTASMKVPDISEELIGTLLDIKA